MRLYNIHPGAIGTVARTLGTDYGTALRLCQLLGFLDSVAQKRGTFYAAHYSRLTTCHRDTIAKDLKLLESRGWVRREIVRGKGSKILWAGLPAEKSDAYAVGNGLPTAQAGVAYDVGTNTNKKQTEDQTGGTCNFVATTSAQPPSKKKKPKPKTNGWTTAQKELVVKVWNEHKPKNFQSLRLDSLNDKRCKVVAEQMKGAGGTSRFLEELPKLLAYLSRHKYWGKPRPDGSKVTWENFFGRGTGTNKQHLIEALDAVAQSVQGVQPDRRPLSFNPVSERWAPTVQMDADRMLLLAVEEVRQGRAPASALADLDNWTPTHPANEPIRKLLA